MNLRAGIVRAGRQAIGGVYLMDVSGSIGSGEINREAD
jgi:hypothetical protein